MLVAASVSAANNQQHESVVHIMISGLPQSEMGILIYRTIGRLSGSMSSSILGLRGSWDCN